MPLGSKPPLDALATGLNPVLFRQFVRDLLGEIGFREMRDFDGCGDGGRDLEALDPQGNPCIIQLKYREDPNKTTSATEFAELPMALLKFGRKRGLFITNGRITAPAKRDAVNSYPNFTLSFMEGLDLLDVLNSSAPLTSSLWMDGTEIRYIQRRARFDIICRSFPQDKSFFLDQLKQIVNSPNWSELIGEDAVTVTTIARSTFEYHDFEPFRPPNLLTMSEGFFGSLTATEINIHGGWSIDQLPQIQKLIGLNIASQWSSAETGSEICAVRVSRPSISVNANLETVKGELEPLTIAGRNGETLLESELVLRDLGVWEKPSWIQSYQEGCGLYYLLWSDANLLCSLRYETMISRTELGMALSRRVHFDRWWERSIFCYVKQPMLTDRETSDPFAPHFCYPWYDKQWIVTWLHPRLQGGMERGLFGDERDDNYDPLKETPSEIAYLQMILNLVKSMRLKRLEPSAAYHANCFAADGEAAPSVVRRTYSTGKLLEYTSEVPSPIDFFDIQPCYAAVYIFEDSIKAEAATQFLNNWKDIHWKVNAEYNPALEEDYESIKFFGGSLDRSFDNRVVLINVRREDHTRLLLPHQLKSDSDELPDLFARMEKEANFQSCMRQSRQWLRQRWRVYYKPEYPSPDNEQVFGGW
jgi:hypothetical protein